MKTLLLDTNILLRFILKDNDAAFNKAKTYLQQAKKGQLKAKIVSAVIPEIVYVLAGYYQVSRQKIASIMTELITTPYLDIEQRTQWEQVFSHYPQNKLDLVDLYLVISAQETGAQLATFDQELAEFWTNFSSSSDK